MKKIFYFLVVVFGVCFSTSCTNAKVEPVEETRPAPYPTYTYMTEDTAAYLRLFESIPSLQPMMSELRKEIPEYLHYVSYLSSDSVEGISFDLLGMIHGAANNYGREADIIDCQSEIAKIIKEYDYIGAEGFTGFGVLTKDEFIKAQLSEWKYYEKFLGTDPPDMEKNLSISEKIDAVTYHFFTSKTKNVIAAEAKMLSVIQQYLVLSGEITAEMNQYLNDLRSEIAIGKVIAYIRQNHLETKSVVMTCGVLHLEKLVQIAGSIGIEGLAIIPGPCR